MAPEERERRLDRFYRPYHDAVGAHDRLGRRGLRRRRRSSSRCIPSRRSCRACQRPGMSACCGICDDRVARPLIDMLAKPTHT